VSDHREAAAAKQTLRRSLLAARSALAREERVRADRARTALVIERLSVAPPAAVAAYLSVATEPSTHDLVTWLSGQDIEVWLPVLTGFFEEGQRRPAWARFSGWDRLDTGPYGISQPVGPAVEAVPHVPWMIVPALAATLAGHRLGRGGGWYDRALGTASPDTLTLALLNEAEVLPDLPVEEHDRAISVIVTPQRWITCSP
jgi:5-formyltetrahydrofolate cyclo-ligase